jgi:DNA-binding IclR family transcriptional regulator
VPSYRAVLCLVQRAGHWDARPHRRELVPAHASAGGKVLLGHREDSVTERTIVDADALRADCAACVERGVACETGEYRPGLESIAAPVREPSGEVVAAVAVTAPADLEILDQADAVRAAAADVETRLAEHAA